MNKILSIQNAVVSFGDRKVLRGLSLEIEAGKITAVIGPKSAGKSSLLRLIAGMLTPDEGEIFFIDENITDWTAAQRAAVGIGSIMLGGGVFSGLTIAENLQTAASLPTGNGAGIIERTMKFFPLVSENRERRAGALSGGERLLLAIAMQMIRQPEILLLDEPSAGLSPQMADTVFDSLTTLNKEFGTSIIVVEQNIAVALRNAHQALALSDGQIFLKSARPAEWLGAGGLDPSFLKGNLLCFAKAN